MRGRRTVHRGCLAASVVLLLALAPATARAATQARADPSDAPVGPSGKADLREVTWDVSGPTATLTVRLDESTYGGGQRADVGVHVLFDSEGDGIADNEIVATRNADGTRMDLGLRSLHRTLSTADCQDLDGTATGQAGVVSTTIANGLETFTFSFDPTVVPGGLSAFRWAAFGQAPADAAQSGPWDVMPDAANPDPGAANPGGRRCNASLSGLRVRMSAGIAFPDAAPLDTDADGIADATDNCPSTQNADQANNDGDSEGDACDPDDDNDTVDDGSDNCTTVANTDQANADGDDQGDSCDSDDDNDGTTDATDNCPVAPTADAADTDGDGQGDACDQNDDNDAALDAGDACALLVGGAANGCPDIDRTLTLAFKEAAEKLHGTLRPAGPCAAAQKVKVFLVRSGPDKRIGAATTKPSGTFKLAENAEHGKYYASVGTETITGVGNCLAARSKRVGR